MRTRNAVFPGRFQPPNIAHAATVESILRWWPNVTIAISTPSDDLDFDERWRPYIEASKDRVSAEKQIFSANEIAQMWSAWIEISGFADRAFCVSAPRTFLRRFSQLFPSKSFDLVYPTPHQTDTDGDKCRHELYPQLLDRPIYLVEPPFRLRNTQIRTEIEADSRTWEESLPPGTIDVFHQIEGPDRLKRRKPANE